MLSRHVVHLQGVNVLIFIFSSWLGDSLNTNLLQVNVVEHECINVLSQTANPGTAALGDKHDTHKESRNKTPPLYPGQLPDTLMLSFSVTPNQGQVVTVIFLLCFLSVLCSFHPLFPCVFLWQSECECVWDRQRWATRHICFPSPPLLLLFLLGAAQRKALISQLNLAPARFPCMGCFINYGNNVKHFWLLVSKTEVK